MLPYYLFAFCVAAVATAAPQKEAQRRAITAAPTATGVLPKATYIGASSQGIEAFRGIPFAVPPVNTDRLKPPASLTVPLGTVQATGKPDGCPQQLFATKSTGLTAEVTKLLKDVPLLQSNQTSSEDCLTLNIERPAGTKPGDKLPVVFWIFGGGFEFGSTNTYSGANIIRTSVAQGTPILYVATNYRLGGWGFLGGKEIKEAGSSNLGLLDQRLALQWVADNIAKFGGDPSKVTIWGESAVSHIDFWICGGILTTREGFRQRLRPNGFIQWQSHVQGQKFVSCGSHGQRQHHPCTSCRRRQSTGSLRLRC